jgi:hypothetical protein
MKREITRLDVMSVAVMYGASLALMGLFFALLFFMFGSMFGAMMGKTSLSGMMGGSFIMLILLPLFYGGIGLVFGAIFASIYNVLAPRVGGVKMYVRESAE